MDTAQHISADLLLVFSASLALSPSGRRKTVIHREQTLIDALLLRFRNIVELVTIPDGEVMKEAAAAQSFQMQVETAALVRACEDLLKLTREIKEMWLVGPLRALGEKDVEAEKKMDEDAKKVGETFEELLIRANKAP